MRLVSGLLALAAFFATINTASAVNVPARISYLACGGYQFGVGGVSIVFNGRGFTITETSAFGVPFIQQATLLQADSETGEEVTFQMRAQLTKSVYTLNVEKSGRGRASTQAGSMDLLCTGDISAI